MFLWEKKTISTDAGCSWQISLRKTSVYLETSGRSPAPCLGEAQTQNCQVQTVHLAEQDMTEVTKQA